jgi:hypothetical protein
MTPLPRTADTRATPPCRTDTTVYDWNRFGRHRLRSPAAVVVDCPVAFNANTWMATVWPDERSPEGWSRMLWCPDETIGRGWVIPDRLALGDVIEFGSVTASRDERWYGLLDSYDVSGWLTLQGPYADPGTAQHDADRLLAAERYLPPLAVDSGQEPARSCRRRRGNRRHR